MKSQIIIKYYIRFNMYISVKTGCRVRLPRKVSEPSGASNESHTRVTRDKVENNLRNHDKSRKNCTGGEVLASRRR